MIRLHEELHLNLHEIGPQCDSADDSEKYWEVRKRKRNEVKVSHVDCKNYDTNVQYLDEDEGTLHRRTNGSLFNSLNEFDVTEDSDEEPQDEIEGRRVIKKRKKRFVIPENYKKRKTE